MKKLQIALLTLLIFVSVTSLAKDITREDFDGREMLIYVPSVMPEKGSRALVVVLHGGMGNANHIHGNGQESGMKMDAVAERNGFVVAYLNGTQAMRAVGKKMLAWNAGGGCCGQPARTGVDDIAYITGAIKHLIKEYGINSDKVYGIGHSNGGIMTQRLVCETGVYSAAIPISAPLNIDTTTCPAAKGKHILAIHGADDENVPIKGGKGTKGISGVNFKSHEYSEKIFKNSGADYKLYIVKNADHNLNNIDAAIQKTEGQSLAEKAARYFGLMK